MIHINSDNQAPYAQGDLNGIEAMDTHGFLKGIEGNNWVNHRPMLYLALCLTRGPVVEMGAGLGSTYMLHKYCTGETRPFTSWDSNPGWVNIFPPGMVYLTNNWNNPDIYQICGLAFIDHAPGEHRKVAVEKFKGLADVIVVHDTELHGAGDYQLEPILNTFKYRLNFNATGGGAGATAVSDIVDLNRYRGLTLGGYKFDNN